MGRRSGSCFFGAIPVFLAKITDPSLGTHSGPLAKDAALICSQYWPESVLFEFLSVFGNTDALVHGVFVLLGAFYLADEYRP